jgi:hypothetical protein
MTIANFPEARARRHLPPVLIRPPQASLLLEERSRLEAQRAGLLRLAADEERKAREHKATAEAAYDEAARIRERLDFGVHA